jgi:hypothetical protein
MNENEQDFDGLRRLLALKRHEVPPPGYFENLSTEIRARLRAGDGSQAQEEVKMPWLLRLLSAFEAKPAFAGVFASALCMMLLGAIVFAERPPVTVAPPLTEAEQTPGMTVAVASTTDQQAPAQPSFITSTNPVLSFASAQPAVGSFGSPLLTPSTQAALQPVSLTLP